MIVSIGPVSRDDMSKHGIQFRSTEGLGEIRVHTRGQEPLAVPDQGYAHSHREKEI
jgi:hypothetical protein